MYTRPISILICSSLLLAATHAGASEEAPAKAPDWKFQATQAELSDEDVEALDRDGILITNDAYKQVFSAYLSGDLPIFITSDSLLNAYHVLYEESVLRLENAMAARMPEILRLILDGLEASDDHLKGDPELARRAGDRGRLVIGIALRLLDDGFRFEDDSLDAILDAEVARIVKAGDVMMPDWLGEPDPSFTALDYSRYQPRGFYTRSDRLQRYFRAVSWLQSIPFRVGKDEELLAILMLGNTVTYGKIESFAKAREIDSFLRAYRNLIGAGDDWDLMSAAHEAQNDLDLDLDGDALEGKRTWLRKSAEKHGEGPLVNDQIRFAPADPAQTTEPNFRIIAAYRIPSAILFQRTTDLRKFQRDQPEGLEVAAALGSKFARKHLRGDKRKDLLQTIDSCRTYFRGDSLYFQYLRALEALLDEPEPDAPEFMGKEAWQAKSCNTALGGWAQLRHTWSLQAKQSVHYLGLTRVPPGFVEPEPQFFSRMADLAKKTSVVLAKVGAFEPDHLAVAGQLKRFQKIIGKITSEDDMRKVFSELPQEEMLELQLPFHIMAIGPVEAERGSAEYFEQSAKWIASLAEDIEDGHIDRYPDVLAVIEEFSGDLKDLWERLAAISRRLESLAHKQLRGIEWDEEETRFIEDYGTEIAGIMLYGGNSYLTPRDDSPRVVDIHANPQTSTYFHVGIARPRRIYVLYPWQGERLLTRGAIMPYYEFEESRRLTDKVWKKKLDSDDRPAIPNWLRSTLSNGKLTKPVLDDDH